MKFCQLFIFLLTTSILFETGHCVSHFSNKVESPLQSSLEKGETANVFLHMQESTTPLLKNLKQREFASRTDRLNTVTTELLNQSEISQKTIIQFLKENSVTYKSFWICNQIYIPAANLSLVQKLSESPAISKISQENIIQWYNPPDNGDQIINPTDNPSISNKVFQSWGITKIQAEKAWERKITGEGIIVGVIDTGVRATHESLRNNQRVNYSWYDAVNHRPEPYDDQGHGTHVTGTIVGSYNIGVAPGAQWIHCKALDSAGETTRSDLYECGEFMLRPHLPNGAYPDPSKAPHLVSNSWTIAGGDEFFNSITDAWIAAGIIPFFAIGNHGPKCGTVEYPGDQDVISVGATTQNDSLADFSSRGAPWTNSGFKPDISAPGHAIVSASNRSDAEYVENSGTSMACPHAAGVGALLLSIRNNLTYADMKLTLFATVDNETLIGPSTYCGSEVGFLYPNNAFGYGRINAYKSVLLLSSASISNISVFVPWCVLTVMFFHKFSFLYSMN